jgi:hypothetical protein
MAEAIDANVLRTIMKFSDLIAKGLLLPSMDKAGHGIKVYPLVVILTSR